MGCLRLSIVGRGLHRNMFASRWLQVSFQLIVEHLLPGLGEHPQRLVPIR